VDPDLLALCRLLSNRPRELTRLLESRSPRDALDQDASLIVGDALKLEVEQDVNWLLAEGHHLILLQDDDYPACLKQIHDPPFFLFAAGDRSVLTRYAERVAIVGARKASQYALKQAMSIAEILARHSVLVVSGLALGIDAAAHEGALAAGEATVAVLGTGCDEVYPRRHWRLAGRVQESGLLLSEFPLRTHARPAHFPRRNRIVTGLSKATVVVEAALKSGSLISAKLALAEGREVMAVPGLVTNQQARGCHQLIRDGALLIESGEDVLKELGIGPGDMLDLSLGGQGLTPEQERLLDLLKAGPVSMDGLLSDLELSIEDLTVALVMLEVMGLVHSEGGRFQSSQL
jgi:DNA processing protein